MWTKPRSELLDVAAKLCQRGYSAEALADDFTRWYYEGKSPTWAANYFFRDLRKRVIRERYERLCHDMGEVNAKAAQLEAEGWRYLAVPGCAEGFWHHDRLGSVNQLGGGFESFTVATERAYSSAIRALAGGEL
ncbi:MAG: hypothetical protein V9H69_24065 [Anaerolineae bacterium]